MVTLRVYKRLREFLLAISKLRKLDLVVADVAGAPYCPCGACPCGPCGPCLYMPLHAYNMDTHEIDAREIDA